MAADARTEQRSVEWLTTMGVEDVRLEPVPLTRWNTVEGESTVEVCAAGGCGAGAKLTVFPSLGVESPRTVTAPLVAFDGGVAGITGAIVVLNYPMRRFVPAALAAKALFVHDPESNLSQTNHPDSRPQNSPAAMQVPTILRARPAAIICGLENFFDTPFVFGVPTVALSDSTPVVFASASTRAALVRAIEAGRATARLSVVASNEAVITHNVVGRLRSALSTDIVLFGSHHDGPFLGATEDAAGVALVLAQARYWSQVPEAQRPFEFHFVLTSAHLQRSRGAEAWVSAHPELVARTMLDVHLETPAREFDVDAASRPIDRSRVEPHWFYTTKSAPLVAQLSAAVRQVDYRRTFAVDPAMFDDGPPSDSKAFFKAGIPVLAHISNPAFYMTIEDTLDKVSDEANEQLSRVVIEVVWGLQGQTATSLRAGVEP
ncbi:MAG: M28 family peptidase [Myxococcaceae bacterium]|nr:M28 family peptidase [Myxococcaceae bacterium]